MAQPRKWYLTKTRPTFNTCFGPWRFLPCLLYLKEGLVLQGMILLCKIPKHSHHMVQGISNHTGQILFRSIYWSNIKAYMEMCCQGEFSSTKFVQHHISFKMQKIIPVHFTNYSTCLLHFLQATTQHKRISVLRYLWVIFSHTVTKILVVCWFTSPIMVTSKVKFP